MNFEINGLPPMCGKIAHCVGTYRLSSFNKRPNKLSVDDLRKIKELHQQGATVKELRMLFGVARSTIQNVIGTRKDWNNSEI